MDSWDYIVEREDIEVGDYLVDIKYRRYGYLSPANFNGHPDRWYPAEGEDECELIGMKVKDEYGEELKWTETAKNALWDMVEDDIPG